MLLNSLMIKEIFLHKVIGEVIILMKIVMAYLIVMKMIKILNYSWHVKSIP